MLLHQDLVTVNVVLWLSQFETLVSDSLDDVMQEAVYVRLCMVLNPTSMLKLHQPLDQMTVTHCEHC